MHSTWFSSTFVSFLNFPQIKEGEPNFFGGVNPAEQLIYLVPPFVFQFKKSQASKFIIIH